MRDGGAAFDLVIAGAGMVGVASALWSAERGLRVLLCDPEPPGSGASYGNACTIATYACLPVNDPSVFRRLPALLFGRDSPLSVDPAHVLRHPRWMLSFLSNCRAGRVAGISQALADILSHADAGLNPLIEAAEAEDLVVANGQLTVFSTDAARRGAAAGTALRRRLGVEVEELTAEEVMALEPNLRLPVAGGLRFPGARHLRDPQALVTRLFDRFAALGGVFLNDRVTGTRALPDGVEVTTGSGDRFRAERVAITAGAFSDGIAGSGADRLPLDVERGYHLVFGDHGGLISRPVGWAEGGFYATPTDAGLRLAGTVEIAGKRRGPNPERLAYLRRKGEEMFGPLPGPAKEWLGFRPTFPDAKPVIGPSPASDRIILAYGHQHIGLTLGGITGRIVADLAGGRAPNMDLSAFGADRF